MKKLMICACFALISLSLTACGTVEGMGEDISSASRAVKDAM